MSDNYYDPWAQTRTKHGLEADLVISALQKSIRRADEALACRLAYELYITSDFHEEKMWNRLLVISVEDIGFGNPEAPVIVKTLNDIRKEFPYGDGDRPIFFIQAIRFLCSCKKERSSDCIKNIIMRESAKGEAPVIPDYAYDMHTLKGRGMGRDILYFLEEGSKVTPQWENYDDSFRQRLYEMCKAEATQSKQI